ncbi:arf1-directed gtpase-activating [Stylonychia lemnae]|uniref:Arf1-directed gtpase-activating n=1 Tax=Stylonychia lemnae TaxID=5949 RepID=A0A078AUM0_STYLE|nr:arf1-directed gtpase-activating [Stylonychia lemnae]|eukprot:CDW85716.1 arf1-directed gtpase-activating [Stylonychia lemnae]
MDYQTEEFKGQSPYVGQHQVAFESEIQPVAIDKNGNALYYPEIQNKNLTEIYNYNSLNQTPIVQAPSQTVFPEQLKDMLTHDPYNAYCVDCKVNLSDHASITFGIFLCYECANKHRSILGQDQSFIKSLYNESWDDYSMKFMLLGGNKKFYDFISQYDTQNREIKIKYLHRSAQYHQKMLRAQVDEKAFDYNPPPIEEWKAVSSKALAEVELGMVKSADWMKEKWQKADLGNKIKGLFKK